MGGIGPKGISPDEKNSAAAMPQETKRTRRMMMKDLEKRPHTVFHALKVTGCAFALAAMFGCPVYEQSLPGTFSGDETQNAQTQALPGWLSHLKADLSRQELLETERLIAGIRSEILQHPTLVGPAASVAADWLPAMKSLQQTDGEILEITPKMLGSLSRLLDGIEAATGDHSLATAAGRINTALRSHDLDGIPIDAAISRLAKVAATEPFVDDASLRMTRSGRGLARENEALMIPAAAHSGGALGTRWRTDLVLTAAGGNPTSVTLALLPKNQANPQPQTQQISIEGGQSRALDDILETLFQFSGTAALQIRCNSGSVAVTSRTYNLEGQAGSPDSRTFGQFVPALSDDDAIVFGSQGHLVHLSHDPSLSRSQRTNIILVNGGTKTTTVEVELFTSMGQSLGTVSRSLGAWEFSQFDRVFEEVTPSVVDDGYAVVRVQTTGGRVFALASVVDNLTGDPVAVPAVLRAPHDETYESQTVVIPAAAKVSGFGDTDWRTDLVLTSLTEATIHGVVTLLPRGEENSAPTQLFVQIPQGQSIRYEDVLDSLFAVTGAATLRIQTPLGTTGVSSRTYNVLGQDNAAGYPAGATFGQYMGPVDSPRWFSFGEDALIPHLSHDPTLIAGNRTNLGLVNTSDHTIDLEVDLFENEGSLLGTVTISLRQWENVQISKVFERVTGDTVSGGYAVVRTTDATGSFIAFGSVVDNTTGDPITVDAVGLRRPVQAGLAAGGDMLMKVFESGGSIRTAYELLQEGILLDAIEGELPEFVTRTPGGIDINLGGGAGLGETVFAAGRISLEHASAVDGSHVTGTLTVDFDDMAVDGLAPVVNDLELGLDLTQITGNHITGTMTLGSTGLSKTVDQLGGSLVFDTRICEIYPIGGSITVTISGEERTLTFSNRCDGGFEADIPSAEYYSLALSINSCQGGKMAQRRVINLIKEDGMVSVDPSSPPGIEGRRRYDARGVIGDGGPFEASIQFAQKAGAGNDGERVIGSFQGRQTGSDDYVYYTGSYGYSVAEGECRSSYLNGRDDPNFEPGILMQCEGPCDDSR